MRNLHWALAGAIVATTALAGTAQADTSATCSLTGPIHNGGDAFYAEGVADCTGTIADYTVRDGRWEMDGNCASPRLRLSVDPVLAWDPESVLVKADLSIAHDVVDGIGRALGQGITFSGTTLRGHCHATRLSVDLVLGTGPTPPAEPAETSRDSAPAAQPPARKATGRKRSCRRAKSKIARKRCARQRRAARR